MRAVQIKEFGGPDVLEVVEDAPVPEAGEHEILIEVSRAGMNFADTHARENTYLARYDLPLTPGGEVVGTDPDGNRVVALLATGGYAEYAVAPKATTYPVPDGLDDGAALALVLQGLTAWHLYKTSAKLAEGESVVVHAAAGGVGNLAVQLAKPFGAGRVIATASSDEKRNLALELGADVAVDAAGEGMKDRLIEANGGEKVDVVLHMSGTGFEAELHALGMLGRMVCFGNAARHPNELQTNYLLQTSKSVIGFWLVALIARRQDLVASMIGDLLGAVAGGELEVVIGGTYPLSEAARAHEDMQERSTTGKLLLDPSK